MTATLPLQATTMNAVTNFRDHARPAAADCALVEIHSYLAARDLLLREAEAKPTEQNLRRALAANEIAENYLRPARSPYQTQSLSETEAVEERRRCQAVKQRLAELRERATPKRCAA